MPIRTFKSGKTVVLVRQKNKENKQISLRIQNKSKILTSEGRICLQKHLSYQLEIKVQ